MELFDMERRLATLTELYAEASDQDEQVRLNEQMEHYKAEIKIAKLEAELMALEFEARRELDQDRDDTMDAIDSIRLKLQRLKT